MLVWYALLTVYISTGPLRYEQAFNRRLTDLSPASYWSHSSKILEDNSLSLYLERSDYSLKRSDIVHSHKSNVTSTRRFSHCQMRLLLYPANQFLSLLNVCCGSILSLVQISFPFVSNSCHTPKQRKTKF